MRSFESQFSDNRPVRRTREEKVRQLAELKETLRGMKQHTSPSLRESISAKIKELDAELAAPAQSRDRRPEDGYGAGPRPPRGPRADATDALGPRRPRPPRDF